MRMPNGHKKRPFIVEIRFVPLSEKEEKERSKRVMELLLTGALAFAQERKHPTAPAA